MTNSAGTVVSTIELDPWGGDTNRNNIEAFQPRRFTTYDRDGNASDEAMHRRYNRWHSRFDQPDPYGGSYDITDPQSFNRYSYVQNDPVNFVDPSGLCPEGTVAQPDALGDMQCVGVGVNGVTINISGGGRSSGAGGASSGPIEIETNSEPTGAEIIPQGPAPGPVPTDPCEGRKNQLTYRIAGGSYPRVGGIGNHISDRHINLTMFPGKSKYVFHIELHLNQSNAAMRQKASIVSQRNMATFQRGNMATFQRATGTHQMNGNIAYVYAFPSSPGNIQLGISENHAANGIDRPNGDVITNINTLIVKPDCDTVVTSFPGTPSASNFAGGVYNITGTPRTFPLDSPQNPGWR